MSRIVVTGGAGTLGGATVECLTGLGHDVVNLDLRACPVVETIVADIRDAGACGPALAGVDTLVHLASLHGRDHMSRFGFEEFWSTNVDGTRTLYECAAQAGVRLVVLASSMAVYGPIPVAPQRRWESRSEEGATHAYDAYSLTKLTCELIAERAARQLGVSTIVLCFGHFTPASALHYGFRLLSGGVDVRDAATAVAVGMGKAPAEASVTRINIHAPSPLESYVGSLDGEPVELLKQLFPEFLERLAERGDDPRPHLWGRSVWPIDRARSVIGYEPVYSFERFTQAYLADDLSDYANLAALRWGVDDTGPGRRT